VLALRRTTHEANPGAAGALYRAFDDAKHLSLARARARTVPGIPLPWAADEAQLTAELIGHDFWPYGIEPNRVTLDAFFNYAAADGLTPQRLSADTLFEHVLIA